MFSILCQFLWLHFIQKLYSNSFHICRVMRGHEGHAEFFGAFKAIGVGFVMLFHHVKIFETSFFLGEVTFK